MWQNVMGEGEGGEKKKYPVCTSIAWYRTLTLFVKWRIIQSSLDRQYFNNLIAFILCVKIIATSDDWRSKSRECYLEGSKWKTGHQVGQCLVHVTKSICMYRRFVGVFFCSFVLRICSFIGTFLFSFAIPVLLMPNAKDSTEQNTGKWRYGVSLPARRHRRHIQLENKH